MIENVTKNTSRRIPKRKGLMFLVIVTAVSLASGQENPSASIERGSIQGMYTGVVSCASTGCHGSPAPVANSNVLMNEYDSWLHSVGPTHVKAHEVLFNKESALIAKNMRLGKPAWEAKLCLDCHATNVPSEFQLNPIEITDGVQCESCHGPASGWRAQHTQEGWTHADSVNAGMIDLRDVSVRTKNCLGCHMGDATKTVDHDLIASGHPLLTFELDNFSESRLMPPHWKKVSEKPEPEAYGAESHGTRAWAVGQVVTFEEGLRHLARQARSERWPEFSAMSCAACHHNLRSGEWRQERGFDGRPGLPPWGPARWAVLRHLVSTHAPDQREALEADVKRLAALVASMGSPEQVAQTATSIADRLSAFERKVGNVAWSENEVRKLMLSIASDGDYFLANDRQSAEQATYALVSLSTHLARSNPRLVRSEIVALVDELYSALDKSRFPDEFDNERFAGILGRLKESLR